jgi:two-component system sensor kinase FixL
VNTPRTTTYLVALFSVGLAFGIRELAEPWVGNKVPFLQFYPAILVSAWFGGFGPGLAATALSAALSSYFYLPPGGFGISDSVDWLALAVFVLTGVAIGALNRSVQTAETSRHEAAQLAVSRATRLDAIINTTVDGIVVIDASGTIEEFNRGAERLFGYEAAEAIGRNVSMLMPSPDQEHHDDYLRHYLETGTAKVIGLGREVRGRRRDGSTFPLHLSVGELRIDGVRKFTGMLHDLTQRAALEAQLRDQENLARLGEMAAVLAHEIKNPLAGIRGAMQIVRDGLPAGFKDADLLRDGIARVDALDRLMRELLMFARPPVPHHSPVEVVSLIETTARLFKHDPELRDVVVDVRGEAPTVVADPQMLELVFHNLLINGAQAMGGRGEIRVNVTATGDECEIAFTDRGPGIPEPIRDKVFSPFFTTKARGSGLGLPTAKRFVEAHHGQILIDASDGGGTRVTVRLPLGAPVTEARA